MTHWTGPAGWARREARAGDRLPYAAQWNEATLRLRDGALMQSIAIAGLPFETSDADQLNHMLGVREVMLRSALDARFVLYHHIIRRKVAVDLPGDFPDPFSGALNHAWQARLGQRQLFVNEQFLTLVRRPARGKTGWPERVARWINRQDEGPDPGPCAIWTVPWPRCWPIWGLMAPAGWGPMLPRTGHAASCSNCSRRFTMARCGR
jgi:type IV secretion system protein VirB4